MIDIRQFKEGQIGLFSNLPLDDKLALERLHYKENFDDFCFRCLGFSDMLPVHYDLCSFLQVNSFKSKLVLMPRYSFKSTICTVGLSLWELVRNPDARILIYSDAVTKAEGFLDSIKAHIEGRVSKSVFRQVFGSRESDVKSGRWNRDQIIISTRTTSLPEPSVDTGGEGTTKVGFHYDQIIFDDIVSDKNITTKDQMDKVNSCYKKALSMLRPGGKILIVGTRWHFGDLYGRIIAENDLKKNFAIFKKEAEVDPVYGKYPFAKIGLTEEFLGQQKLTQGSSLYSCLYNNNPVSDETAVFKMSDFAFYGDVLKNDLYITATCDPAGEGEDFTAITIVGTDNNMDMYILDVVNEHLQPSGIVEKLILLQYRWGYSILGIETNFFRGMLEPEIKRRRDEEHRNNGQDFKLFGVHEFEASSRRGSGKHARIMSLQPFHERRAIKFPGEKFELLEGAFCELSWQMVQYTHDGSKSPHDDLCFIKGTKIATLFGDKNIEDIKIGEKVITPFGIDEVIESKSTGYKKVISNMGLIGTPNHKVFTYDKGEITLDTLTYRDIISILSRKEMCQWIYRKLLFLMELPTNLWGQRNALKREGIILASQIPIRDGKILKDFTWRNGNFIIKRQFLSVIVFTIKTVTLLTTTQVIWNVYHISSILENIQRKLQRQCLKTLKGLDRLLRLGTLLKRVNYGIETTLNFSGRTKNKLNLNVFGAEKSFYLGCLTQNFALELANRQEEEQAEYGTKQRSVFTATKNSPATSIATINSVHENVQQDLKSTHEVFNLTVKNSGMYFANGILVSNCDALAYQVGLIRKGGVAKKAGPLVNTPAWLELQSFNKEVLNNQRLPRRLRRRLPDMAFN